MFPVVKETSSLLSNELLFLWQTLTHPSKQQSAFPGQSRSGTPSLQQSEYLPSQVDLPEGKEGEGHELEGSWEKEEWSKVNKIKNQLQCFLFNVLEMLINKHELKHSN